MNAWVYTENPYTWGRVISVDAHFVTFEHGVTLTRNHVVKKYFFEAYRKLKPQELARIHRRMLCV